MNYVIGKPKFKITETDYGDGWSVFIGYGNDRYIRINYGDIPSIDIFFLNHKGSIRFKDKGIRRNVDGKYFLYFRISLIITFKLTFSSLYF